MRRMVIRRPHLVAICAGLGLLVSALVPVEGRPRSAGLVRAGCRPERALSFLIRKSYVRGRALDAEGHARALRWRATTYGHVPGLGLEQYNPRPVSAQVRTTSFFGLPITLHEKVIPSLHCVEKTIQRECQKPRDRYQPKAIGGLRTMNTCHGGEVSNHLFGIAIDIDPDRNPCCHCVEPWPAHPACRRPARSVYERAALTRCWIRAFEQHGFYWLGHDQLQDTMHFEYLADPSRRASSRAGSPKR